MKTILHIDSSIKTKNLCNGRISQYINGLNSIFKHQDFFIANNIDIIYVDNTISDINEFPMIRDIIPNDVKCIFKLNNNYGNISNTAGVLEHWALIENILENYDYIIHFEARQTLLDLSFFEDFLKEPMPIFSWGFSKLNNRGITFPLGKFKQNDPNFKIDLYGRDNHNCKDVYFNDYYTGLFSFNIPKLKEFIKTTDLNKIITPPMTALEKCIMNFTYDKLDVFKLIDRVGIIRYYTYDSLNEPTYY
jgi:hypothetical protein